MITTAMYDKHLNKARGPIGRNDVNITIKIKSKNPKW